MILYVNSGSASGSSAVKVAASGCNMPKNVESKIRYHLRASSLLFPNPHLPQSLLSSAGLLPDSHLHSESLHPIHRTPESKPFLTSRLQPASAACSLRRHCSWHAGVNPHPLRRSSPQIHLRRHSSCYISLIRTSHIRTPSPDHGQDALETQGRRW